MSAHAPLMPSAAGRWVHCPGSVGMEARYPDDDSEKAREGTAAHWAASELLNGRAVALGQVAENGVVLDAEMIEGATLYAEVAQRDIDECSEHAIERRVDVPYVHADNWGTPDYWAFGTGALYVGDFKYGRGHVEVFENFQLIDYACGVLDYLNINGSADQYLDVVFRIVQPRSYHADGPVRTWRINAAALRPYFNRLQAAATAAMQPDAPARISVECKHCNGRHACKALQRAAYDAVDVATASIPVELPAEAIGLELRTLRRAAKMLDARIAGIEEVALASIRRGANVPGFKIEHGKGRKRWARPVSEIVTMAKLMDVDVSKALNALTPAQAIAAGLPRDVVDAFAETPTGEAKLKEDDGTLARRIFG